MQQVISQLDHLALLSVKLSSIRKNPIEYYDTMSDFVLKYGIEEEVIGQQ
jgi:hypothetical protein